MSLIPMSKNTRRIAFSFDERSIESVETLRARGLVVFEMPSLAVPPAIQSTPPLPCDHWDEVYDELFGA